MTTITIHNVNFIVESDGWSGHDDARDAAVDALWDRLNAMTPDAVARLHAGLTGDDEHETDISLSLADAAVRSVTADWRCYEPGYYGVTPALFIAAAND